MARQLFIGLITEGPMDVRFLQSVVERTFIDVAFECENDLEPYVRCLTVEKVKLGFNEYVEKASRQGMEEMGMDILCVHTDADSKDTKRAYAEKINPARKHLSEKQGEICKNLIPIVPVRMVEAWMLADKELLKKEIGTTVSDEELGISRMAELYSDPKDTIIQAINKSNRTATRRHRRDLDISELYASIGASLDLEKLNSLPSYRQFVDEVREAYRILGLLR